MGREKIKSDNPGISVVDLTRKAGEMWKNVTDRSVWENRAKEAKEAYEKAMKDYKASGGGGASKASPKEKSAKSGAKASAKSTKAPTKSPTKSPSGDFKSKEYISTDDDSSDDGG